MGSGPRPVAARSRDASRKVRGGNSEIPVRHRAEGSRWPEVPATPSATHPKSREIRIAMGKRTKRLPQAAVIAIRRGRVCLITSSSGKRWLVPKGNLQRGRDLRETALQEAWEEAGLVGRVEGDPLGTYEFEKLGCLYEVVVFCMQVEEAKRDWPERARRVRRWMRPGKAVQRIAYHPLRAIVREAMGGRQAA